MDWIARTLSASGPAAAGFALAAVCCAAAAVLLAVLLGDGVVGADASPVAVEDGVPVYPVPVLSPWSHVALIALLAGTGAFMLRRHARIRPDQERA